MEKQKGIAIHFLVFFLFLGIISYFIYSVIYQKKIYVSTPVSSGEAVKIVYYDTNLDTISSSTRYLLGIVPSSIKFFILKVGISNPANNPIEVMHESSYPTPISQAYAKNPMRTVRPSETVTLSTEVPCTKNSECSQHEACIGTVPTCRLQSSSFYGKAVVDGRTVRTCSGNIPITVNFVGIFRCPIGGRECNTPNGIVSPGQTGRMIRSGTAMLDSMCPSQVSIAYVCSGIGCSEYDNRLINFLKNTLYYQVTSKHYSSWKVSEIKDYNVIMCSNCRNIPVSLLEAHSNYGKGLIEIDSPPTLGMNFGYLSNKTVMVRSGYGNKAYKLPFVNDNPSAITLGDSAYLSSNAIASTFLVNGTMPLIGFYDSSLYYSAYKENEFNHGRYVWFGLFINTFDWKSLTNEGKGLFDRIIMWSSG